MALTLPSPFLPKASGDGSNAFFTALDAEGSRNFFFNALVGEGSRRARFNALEAEGGLKTLKGDRKNFTIFVYLLSVQNVVDTELLCKQIYIGLQLVDGLKQRVYLFAGLRDK